MKVIFSKRHFHNFLLTDKEYVWRYECYPNKVVNIAVIIQFSEQYQNFKKERNTTILFQIDLVDMSSKLACDGNFRYIAHYVDHFTKYNVIWPMEKEDAAELARGYK